MAPSWREEYIQALHERDKREKASYERLDDKFIEACEHLPLFTFCVLVNVVKIQLF
jgi:hypothetical protein